MARPFPRWFPWLAPGLVLFASLFGLLRVISFFGRVWTASWVGDLVFVLGTLGSFAAALRAARGRSDWLALPVAFLLEWFTYGLAWSITVNNFGEQENWPLGYSLRFTLWIGWQGLAACALLAVGLARWKRLAPDATQTSGSGPSG